MAKNRKKPQPRPSREKRDSSQSFFVGRDAEKEQIFACLKAGKNVLLEGPVGAGKTTLALSVVEGLGIPSFRIDGDNRFNEQKLTGLFDPPAVLKKGYQWSTFLPGPLVEAMQKGGVLFINELNRLPEGVQNVLLPAIDERKIVIPRLGEVVAKPGFTVVATQNPKEFVATSHLSEAILDRFELVVIDYQTEKEEVEIVESSVKTLGFPVDSDLCHAAVLLARLTRNHPKIRRGASVRAALAVAEIATVLKKSGKSLQEAFTTAARLSLPTRIEIERDAESDAADGESLKKLISELTDQALAGSGSGEKKKN